MENEEKKVEEVKTVSTNQNGNKKGSSVIIIILLIAVLGLGGYIAYDKILGNAKTDDTEEKTNKDEKTDTKKEEKVENLDVTNKEVTTLFKSVTNANGHYCGVSELFKDKKVAANDIDNDLASDIALYNIRMNGKELNEGVTFTKKEMNDTIAKLFGKDYKYTHGDIKNCPSVKYDANTEIYKVQPSACGGTCGPKNYVKIVKATKTNSKIELSIRVLFVGDTDVTNAAGNAYPRYYKDSNKTVEVELQRDYDNIPYETDENYQKGSLYKMIFTNEDGNYVFTSSELVNE